MLTKKCLILCDGELRCLLRKLSFIFCLVFQVNLYLDNGTGRAVPAGPAEAVLLLE